MWDLHPEPVQLQLQNTPGSLCLSSVRSSETMLLSHTVLYLGLLVTLGPLVWSEQEAQQQPQPQPQPQPQAASPAAAAAEDAEQCATCEVRQQIKTMRLNAIKSQILSKLRMKEAPNISRDIVKQLLPKAPPLQQLLDQYDVLGDDNRDVVMEEDDEHATTETIMVMATERESLFDIRVDFISLY